jgi:UDP-GlcNAc:undecaprenyl-phosphate/decaprenyl-phosphate GlcNAc-1-phosphate transferase
VETLFGFILSLSITMVLIPVLMRWAAPLQILDIPEARKVHESPIPRIGGIAMVIATLLAMFLWGAATRPMKALWVCMGALLVFGVWDDRKTLAAGPKFAGQAIAALVAIGWGGFNISYFTDVERVPVPFFVGIPLTFLFLIGGTNAFNLSDGLDGLAGGVATLCLCGIALLAYTLGNLVVGGAAVVIIGALIGFLRFNTHPARVFMGDGGSQVLGFCAAALALMLTQDPQIPLSTALPLLLLGIPIIDTLMVMTERMLAGRSPFTADRRHIHHRLLALGFQHWEAVSILYLLQGGLLIAAWFMRYDSDLIVALSFVAFSALIIVPLRLAAHFNVRFRGSGQPGLGQDLVPSPRQDATRISLRMVGARTLAIALACYALWVLCTGALPSSDVRLLAGALAIVLGLGLAFRWQRTQVAWTDKFALYSCAALAMFIGKHSFAHGLDMPGAGDTDSSIAELILYAALALSTMVCVRTSDEGPFKVTPLDVLVLLLVLTLPNLPNSVANIRSLGWTIGELVVLFYALETLSQAVGRRWRWLSGTAVLFLIGLMMRAHLAA